MLKPWTVTAIPVLVVLQITFADAAATDTAAGTLRSEIRFSEELRLRDIVLKGERATARVDFFTEPGSKPVTGSVLRLSFDHASDLEDRSFLSVWLNHGVLRSVRLDSRAGPKRELEIPIPEGMLQSDNQLVFTVEQAAPREERLWTRILAASSLSIAYRPMSSEWNLADIPAPLLHRRSYGARRLTVLLPESPSPSTTESLAIAVANLCRRVAPEPVSLEFVRQLSDATSPVLLVGTPREQPSLRTLALPRSLRLSGDGFSYEGTSAKPTVGIRALAVSPYGGRPVLVVSGSTPHAVSNAARAIHAVGPKGERAQLVPGGERPVRGARQWLHFAPPRNRFTLAEVLDEDAELAVTAATPARARIRVTPDTRFLGYGHSLRLPFRALPAISEDPDAFVEVYWNDALVRQEAVRSLTPGSGFSFSLRLRDVRLEKDNMLTIAWNGRSGASGPFLMLQPDTELHLAREYESALPDLALLRSSLYPLSLRPDLSDTTIVMPNSAGDDGIAALCELAAWLGRELPTDALAFRVADASTLEADGRQRNLILLETTRSAVPAALPPPDIKSLPQREALRQLPVVQAWVSPWNRDRHVLRILAASPGLLRAAVRSLSRPATLDRLTGDTAFLSAEGPVSFRLGTQHRFAEISYLARLSAWLRDHWLALPAILALVSGLLFMALRLSFDRRRGTERLPHAA